MLWLLLPGTLSAVQYNSVARAAADTARRYTWVRETTPNRSPQIDTWCKKMGMPNGVYWCLISVWNWFDNAAHAQGVKNPLPKLASVNRMLAYANSLGSGLKVIPVRANFGANATAQKGDIFCMTANSRTDPALIGKWWNGHTGIVEQDLKQYVATIEGNTNGGGSRNGDRVAERTRNKNTLLAFIRVL